MTTTRKLAVVFGFIGLALVYVGQKKLFYDPFLDFIYNPVADNYPDLETNKYVFSKLFRFLLNDSLAILIIYGFFGPVQNLTILFCMCKIGGPIQMSTVCVWP